MGFVIDACLRSAERQHRLHRRRAREVAERADG